jgi:hypothetical protein
MKPGRRFPCMTDRDPASMIVTCEGSGRFLAHWPNFVDLQVSEHARGNSIDEARRNLLARSGPDYAPGETPEIGPEPPPL